MLFAAVHESAPGTLSSSTAVQQLCPLHGQKPTLRGARWPLLDRPPYSDR